MKQRNNEEDRLHRTVATFLSRALPNPAEAIWLHYPAGEKRSAFAGAKLKAYGARAGVPDLYFRWSGGVGWLELKADKGVVSPEQRRFMEQVEQLGDKVAVVRTLEVVEATLRSWGLKLHASVLGIRYQH